MDPTATAIGTWSGGRFMHFGEPLDDAACLEILEPYRGHRYRVQLLLSLSAARRPRRAPRMTLPTHTPYATKGRS